VVHHAPQHQRALSSLLSRFWLALACRAVSLSASIVCAQQQ